MANGKNGWITKFLATALWGIVITIMLFIGKSVVANDQLSRERDQEIATEARAEKVELRKEIKEDLKDIKAELKETSKANGEILIVLAELKKDIQAIER